MKRSVLWLVPITLGSVAVVTLVTLPAPLHAIRVYSVAAARAALLRRPAAWIGRTLVVRGRLDGCPPALEPCLAWQPRLFDLESDGASPGTALPVDLVPPDLQAESPLAALQGVPVLGALVSPRHAPRWGVVATYRIQVTVLRTRRCATGTCDSGDDFDVFTCDTHTCYKVLLLEHGP